MKHFIGSEISAKSVASLRHNNVKINSASDVVSASSFYEHFNTHFLLKGWQKCSFHAHSAFFLNINPSFARASLKGKSLLPPPPARLILVSTKSIMDISASINSEFLCDMVTKKSKKHSEDMI